MIYFGETSDKYPDNEKGGLLGRDRQNFEVIQKEGNGLNILRKSLYFFGRTFSQPKSLMLKEIFFSNSHSFNYTNESKSRWG